MALANKRMNGTGVCRVWMWTGSSRGQCLTILAGQVHPLVPGLFHYLLDFTLPNLLRWQVFVTSNWFLLQIAGCAPLPIPSDHPTVCLDSSLSAKWGWR